MYPILFRFGSHIVYSYTVALVLGMLAGVWAAWRAARSWFPDQEIVLDAGFWGLLGGLLGGRAGYVIANWAYFVDYPAKAFALWQGGLAWHGALCGGCVAIFVWVVVRRRPSGPGWREVFDVLAFGLALGGAFGWLGCLLAGCAYGAEASGYAPPLSWFTADLPDIFGVQAERFLTQPLMIVWCLLLWGALWAMRRRLRPGVSFSLYLLLYALADFGIAFIRGDGTWRLGLWLSQWVALVEVCLAIGLTIYHLVSQDAKRGI
ncbi:MAG: prolipoprotein diacylglyceryl transferase [Anaerolineae bacterium]|nr:prolipoprotein diacylglyceryl transferase [Anaerolineae bacterium]